MARKMANKLDLKRDLKEVSVELAALNRELALKMISLADQTGEVQPLIQAINTLRTTQEIYSNDSTPRENAEIQQLLGNTLLKVGRAKDDVNALEHAIKAYRGAITLASMLGDEEMRRELKRDYSLARNLLGHRVSDPSLKGVA